MQPNHSIYFCKHKQLFEKTSSFFLHFNSDKTSRWFNFSGFEFCCKKILEFSKATKTFWIWKMKIHLFVLLIFLIVFVYADKEKEAKDPCKDLTFDRTICNNIVKCVYDDSLKKCVLNKWIVTFAILRTWINKSIFLFFWYSSFDKKNYLLIYVEQLRRGYFNFYCRATFAAKEWNRFRWILVQVAGFLFAELKGVHFFF